MSKYRLTDKEIKIALNDCALYPVSTDEVGGYDSCQKRLIPLLEEKDHLIAEQDLEITVKNNLLKECREFLVSMMGAIDPSPEKHGELLTKLKDI